MINRRRAPLPTFQRLQASMREFDNLPFPLGNGSGVNSSSNNNNNNSINNGSGLGPAMMPGHHAHMLAPTGNPNGAAIVPPSMNTAGCGARNVATSDSAWREGGGEELRRLRSRSIVLIERMLRNHQPHDVLTQVPENCDWRSKTFLLAIKIEKLMFLAATSRENYLNEHTLRSRVQLLSRHLVRIRKRKNAMAAVSAATAV